MLSRRDPTPVSDTDQAAAKSRPGDDEPEVLPVRWGSHPDTEALVRRAQSGEVEALNTLFARYYDVMLDQARRGLGTRLRHKEEPDDLAQTTFREATRDFSSYVFRGESSLLRWLMRILQNKIRDRAEFYGARKRDAGRERAMDPGSQDESGASRGYEPPSPDLSVTRAVERQEAFAILKQGLEKLSPEHRQAIALVFFEGLSLRDAGTRMGGRSEDAVRMLLRRAESHLREIVGRKLGDEPEAATGEAPRSGGG
jgi:RNA polymerase sigma-70 factor (subfamily 1)